MRVTQGMMAKNYLYNLNTNYTNMGKLQQQLSTGHKVSKPSDDPFTVTRTMELKSSIAANERYKQNIEECIGWTDTQEMALGQMNDVLQKVRELTVQAANGTLSDSDKQATTAQLKQLKTQLVEIANTSYDGRYIFSGQKTTDKPFEEVNGQVIYKGSNNGLEKEVSPGVSLDIGINGADFFKAKYTGDSIKNDSKTDSATDKDGIFSTIDKIIMSLENPSDASLEGKNTSNLLGVLDENMENMATIRSGTGAIQNRLEDIHNKNESETFNMTSLLAKTYDVDMGETYMKSKIMESIYQASLNVGAKVLQPSILDFLK